MEILVFDHCCPVVGGDSRFRKNLPVESRKVAKGGVSGRLVQSRLNDSVVLNGAVVQGIILPTTPLPLSN